MSARRCPDVDELVRLIDGELTESRAAVVREHVSDCSACRSEKQALEELALDVAAPIVAVDVPAMVDRVAAGIAEVARSPAPRPTASRARGARVVVAAAGVLAALAAAVVLVPRLAADVDRGAFASRGAPRTPSAPRDVGLTLFRDHAPLDAIDTDAPVRVRPDTLYSVGYFTRPATRSYWLMVLAVDARGELHWILPPYSSESEDPRSVELPPGRGDTMTPTSTILDRPSEGPLHLLALVTETPVRVKDLESLPPGEATAEALRRRFPGADVRTWSAVVDGATERR